MKIALLCGGPSPERGISLNSARSVLDHLGGESVEILPIYFDTRKKAYRISCAQLYSNTPSDFDFKLKATAKPLTSASLVNLLKTVDLVFPAMHGAFGEDGGIQTFLEHHHIPYVGSPAQACKKVFDKFKAHTFLLAHKFATLPCILLEKNKQYHRARIKDFFIKHNLKRAIVKPAVGGSSIGVFSVESFEEAYEEAHTLLRASRARVVLESFARGHEFTTIILENPDGQPVALPPTEIETSYTEGQIFDFRKKYLPTRAATYHCPPRFSDEVVKAIQKQAEQLFALLGMKDVARFDGWVLEDGRIWFSDFNPISGMEQNSFLFQQAARVGLTHADILHYIVRNACRRYDIVFPTKNHEPRTMNQRKPVSVLMGGPTSERQVSLMSGTNVWLKLRQSKQYYPEPYLLDMKGMVWHVPYHLMLSHTVEEITENCATYLTQKDRLRGFEAAVRIRLGLGASKDRGDFFEPTCMTLTECLNKTAFLFNALHGGAGEDGTLQALCDTHDVPYNGPGEKVSRLCMDKWATSECIRSLHMPGVDAINGLAVTSKDMLERDASMVVAFWKQCTQQLSCSTLIIKPRADGCSTGVAHLFSAYDLITYLDAVREHHLHLLPHTLTRQENTIEMPPSIPSHFLFEYFMETDIVEVRDAKLYYKKTTGWIEITIGILEMHGRIVALHPSITVAEGEVLSVEEKFQGGTGVNITPPPLIIMKPAILSKVKARIEQLAVAIGISGYSRIDAFVSVTTGDLRIIEINTLPGLTPSTVLYQQALAQIPPLFPRDLLELFIANKGY